MSPEQLLSQPLDRRSDIFAVGVVMWTALAGQDLFSADSYEQILANLLHREVPPPSGFGAPPCLDEICLRALSRAREDRFASADEMAEALVKVAAANELIAPPTAVGAFVRRHMAGADVERRKWIESMLPAALVASPDNTTGQVPVVQAGQTSGPLAVGEELLAASAEKKFTKTMIIPAQTAGSGRHPSVPIEKIANLAKRLGSSGNWIAVLVALLAAAWVTVDTLRRGGSARAGQPRPGPAHAGQLPLDPVRPDPARADPARPDPARTDPTRADPVRPDPVRPDPVRPHPTRPDPTRPDPTRSDPTRPDPTRPRPTRSDPTRSDPTRSDPTRPDLTRPDPTRPEPAAPSRPAPARRGDDRAQDHDVTPALDVAR